MDSTSQKPAQLRAKLSFLALDLRIYQSSPSAEKRLSLSVWRHCIGPPYLANELETKAALDCTIGDLGGYKGIDETSVMTLGAYLDQEVEKLMTAWRLKATPLNADDSHDFVLCTSHDLAPILQRALGLNKGFHESKDFKKAYKTWERDIQRSYHYEQHSPPLSDPLIVDRT